MSDNFYDAKEEAEEYYHRIKELEKQNEELRKELNELKEHIEDMRLESNFYDN